MNVRLSKQHKLPERILAHILHETMQVSRIMRLIAYGYRPIIHCTGMHTGRVDLQVGTGRNISSMQYANFAVFVVFLFTCPQLDAISKFMARLGLGLGSGLGLGQ